MTGDLEQERLARLALARTREPGDLWLAHSVEKVGAIDLYEHLRSGRGRSETATEVAGRLADVEPARDLDRARRLGLRFVVPGDDEWPTQVDDLAFAEPGSEGGGPPLGLWARGPVRLDDLGRSVALVGSRSATTYGSDVAAEMAAGCAIEGWTVVSGAAVGIDVAAHRGALAAGGRTVAVLACGADKAYPQGHQQLLDHLAAEHLVVSETVPGGAPLKHRFLTRNRIIVALARGVVVVEAAARSGALNSAGWATRLNRPLMGLPGPVTSAASEGVHTLLRSGRATVATSAEHVLEAVAEIGQHDAADPRGPERAADRLSPRRRQVLEAVPAVRAAGLDSIARVAGLGTSEVSAALHELAAGDLVEADGRGWRLARRPGQEVPRH
ncbi:DNA-processing protein DprA [Nocardioides dilutus]